MPAKPDIEKQKEFLALTDKYKNIIARVCALYSSGAVPFADLYQESLLNIWAGFDSFRGEAKVSTWLYRVVLNTCITWHRRNSRNPLAGASECPIEVPDPLYESDNRIHALHDMIGMLNPVEKALVTLWLDDNSYEEMALVMGMSKSAVATRLHRAKSKLSELARNLNL